MVSPMPCSFHWCALSSRVRHQDQRQCRLEVYALHVPEVECIGKGNARTAYAFGDKAGVITQLTPSKGGTSVLESFPSLIASHIATSTRRLCSLSLRGSPTRRAFGIRISKVSQRDAEGQSTSRQIG